MQFHDPSYLYALLALLPLALLSLWSYWRRRRRLQRFATKELGQALVPLASGKRYLLRDLLLLLAGACLLVALARPQLPRPTGQGGEESLGIEAMICLDISNSMLCADVAPSRLDFAKRTVAGLLEQMHSDRVGLIIFAGSAYIQLPLTSDLTTAKEFLSSIQPTMISDQGTAVKSAIELAQRSFSPREDLGKAIVLLTDGEDFEPGAEEAATEARKQGIRLEVIGVGTDKGGPIPLAGSQASSGSGSGVAPSGQYLTDEAGELVITRFDPEKCQRIAEAGGGIFLSSSSRSTILKEIASQLEELPRGSFARPREGEATELFMPWLVAALLLLLLEFFVLGRKNKFFMRHNIFQSKLPLLLFALLGSGTLLQAQGVKGVLRGARQHYLQKEYVQATQEYERALLRDSLSAVALFGLGTTAYQQGQLARAASVLQRALQDTLLTPRQQADVLHNLGNIAMKKRDYASAVKTYEEALLRNHENEGTRYNLALAQKLLAQQQKPQPKPQSQERDQQRQDQPQQAQPSSPQQKPASEQPQREKSPQERSNPQEQRQGEISKEQAEQLLRAYRADDDKTRQQAEKKLREDQQTSTKHKKRW